MNIKFLKSDTVEELNLLLDEFQKSNTIISIQYVPSSLFYYVMVVYTPKEVH